MGRIAVGSKISAAPGEGKFQSIFLYSVALVSVVNNNIQYDHGLLR